MIQEKLEERKKRWEREMERQQSEQSHLVAEQEKAIKQVLNTQAGLAEEYVMPLLNRKVYISMFMQCHRKHSQSQYRKALYLFFFSFFKKESPCILDGIIPNLPIERCA